MGRRRKNAAEERSFSFPNRLLSALPAPDLAKLVPKLQPVSLSSGEVLYDQGELIEYIYFPTTTVLSMISIMENGASIEQAVIGNEGLMGLAVFLEKEIATARGITQVPGKALRMSANAFKRELKANESLNVLLRRYTHALLLQISRAGACNTFHSLEERCARWLLMMHDRANTGELPITQQFMAEMLGVSRTRISIVAGTLQRAGVIEIGWRRIRIMDRTGLERISCESYQIIREEFESLLA